jgi:hypothetical protein
MGIGMPISQRRIPRIGSFLSNDCLARKNAGTPSEVPFGRPIVAICAARLDELRAAMSVADVRKKPDRTPTLGSI